MSGSRGGGEKRTVTTIEGLAYIASPDGRADALHELTKQDVNHMVRFCTDIDRFGRDDFEDMRVLSRVYEKILANFGGDGFWNSSNVGPVYEAMLPRIQEAYQSYIAARPIMPITMEIEKADEAIRSMEMFFRHQKNKPR